MKKIKNRYDAETLFCEALVEAGFTAGISPYGEEETNTSHQFSADTIKAIHECEFGDPHFIGGPAIFNFAKSRADVDRIFERAAPVVVELTVALEQKNPDQANKFRADLLTIRDWMSRIF
jgi:hypothetical protein